MTWHILKFSGSRCHASHSPINIWCWTTILKFHELVSSVHRFYTPWKYWNFLFFFLFQRAAVRAKSHHGFTTEPMFQLDLTRFTGEVLFVVCTYILFINPLVLPENVLFFSYHKPTPVTWFRQFKNQTVYQVQNRPESKCKLSKFTTVQVCLIS